MDRDRQTIQNLKTTGTTKDYESVRKYCIIEQQKNIFVNYFVVLLFLLMKPLLIYNLYKSGTNC